MEKKRVQVMEAENKGKGLMAPQGFATNLTTLVVDDDKPTRMIHQRLLNNAGVKNMQWKMAKKPKTFIALATKKLRSMGIGSMIVAASPSSKEEEIREFMEAGLNDYKVKPFTFTMLSSIIDKIEENLVLIILPAVPHLHQPPDWLCAQRKEDDNRFCSKTLPSVGVPLHHQRFATEKNMATQHCAASQQLRRGSTAAPMAGMAGTRSFKVKRTPYTSTTPSVATA
ncbi:hypothetical protein Lal_00034445 [Lupinus albus]|nr:hypothetical protein Lal_00034445 [Lupinus albus]